MEDFYMNASLNGSFNNSNVTFSFSEYIFIRSVLTCIIASIGLPLILMMIYALYLQVRDGNVAPIYVINLLITDLFQLCCMIASPPGVNLIVSLISIFIYSHCMVVSVCFMVCVAMERYLVVAHPLWYRFRRTIKSSVLICVVVWVLPAFLLAIPSATPFFLLVPFPLLIFFLCGTVKALSASISVPSDEKRRIVGTLVLVLLIYTLLFLPYIILMLGGRFNELSILVLLPILLSPLADLLLYVFMRKGIIDKLLASVCCCRMDSNDITRAGSNDISTIDISDTRRMDSNDVSRMESNGTISTSV